MYAGEFQCSIKNVLQLSDTGAFVTHDWSANYLNREFTVERETGKVIMTTALKQRPSNYDRDYAPLLLSSGQYALLEINNAPDGNQRPFFYHTSIGMILTGTCKEGT